jgi:hypothetical protein
MSDDQERDPATPEGDREEESGPASTPFDNPFFLPAVLWALALWFGWDIVTDAEAYQNYPKFNLGGFAILGVLASYFTWSAIKEKRAEREGRVD